MGRIPLGDKRPFLKGEREAYERLFALPPDALQSFKPRNKAEAAAIARFRAGEHAANGVAAAVMAARGLRYSKEQLEKEYRLWLSQLLPKHFRSADDEQFAPHHDKFFKWGWAIERDVLPDPPACLYIVNRGGNKSTSVAGLAVALGAMQRRKFGLVITRTETQGDTHIRRINDMLLESKIGSVYPGMTRPKLTKIENREQRAAWNRSMLTTADGWTLQNFSLEAAQRGVGLGQYRPDFIWPTDIDDEHDGPGRVDTLMNAFSASVLGTGSADCVVIVDQNVIHRDSVVSRMLTRKSDVLSDRLTIGPVPAIQQPKYQRRNEHWHITRGKATWSGLPLPACEAKLNVVGMDSWEREYQHNVDLPYADAIYPMFDPVYHCITWSEFARFYAGHDKYKQWKIVDENGPRLPVRGNLAMAQDWGNNHKHPCANRWLYWPGEGMPLTDSVFFYREMCWPRFPKVEDDDREGPSPLQVAKAIHVVEARWKEGDEIRDERGRVNTRMQFRLASHERPEIVKAYKRDLTEAGIKSLSFQQVDTAKAREGILHMQNFLTLIKDEPHPFRIDPRTTDPLVPDLFVPTAPCNLCKRHHVGRHLQGRPRAYFLVADGQGELYVDDLGALKARPAINEHGQARTRDEYPNFRKPDTVQGAERKDAPKIRDDMIDTDRAILGKIGTSIEPLTDAQRIWLRVEAHFPDSDRPGENPIAWDQSKKYYERQWAKEANRPALYGPGMDFYDEERIQKEQQS